jgi:hypothetical protein
MVTIAEGARAEHETHGHKGHGDGGHGHGHGHDCPTVRIHVNNKEVFLHPGRYALATLKKLSMVPLADDLDELVKCELKPLPDDGHVHIEGREVFVSHVKNGGSA